MGQERKAAFLAGDWTIEPELNALRREDVERHIEPKVMKVLLTLASQQNHVFSKEELISAVWPDTFVSDDALTRCISILRRITEDNPHAPRFIQTVPKVGYRLVAPVEELPSPVPTPVVDHNTSPAAELLPTPKGVPVAPELPSIGAQTVTRTLVESSHSNESPEPAVVGDASVLSLDVVPDQTTGADPFPARSGSSTFPWTLTLAACLAVALLCLVAVLLVGRRSRTAPGSADDFQSTQIVPFTSYAGEQTQPAFSPDGRQLAFIRIAEDGSSRRICVKRIGAEAVQELTKDKDEQFSPAWSPDGRQIAYLSQSQSGLGLYVADAPGGAAAPRRLFIPQEPSHWEQGALSWSPDGKSLIFPDHNGVSPSSSIFRLDLESLRVQPITSAPAGWEGDLNPAFSPDGTRIAFTRASETAVRDIYWISVKDGALHQLTHDNANIDSLAWSRDSGAVVFSSNRAGKYALWRANLKGGAAERLPVGTEDAYQPAVGPMQGQLAYTQGDAIWSVDRVTPGSGALRSILSSTQQDSAPSLSPDARWFAFQSRRSGSQEIWIASLDGTSLHQLTRAGGPETGSPAWSHRGDRILFDSRPDGHSHIFAISAQGGKAIQLTTGNANDIVPRWAGDDRTVYFRSNRGGRWQLWKLDLTAGGEPQPITSGDGIVPQESADGHYLYYTRGAESGLWRVPVGGGQEVRVLPQPAAGYWGYFQVTSEGIFYLDRSRAPGMLRLFSPASGQSITVAELRQSPPLYQSLSVGENGKLLLMTGERDAGRHITLVEARP